jgi:hypothetical protein
MLSYQEHPSQNAVTEVIALGVDVPADSELKACAAYQPSDPSPSNVVKNIASKPANYISQADFDDLGSVVNLIVSLLCPK